MNPKALHRSTKVMATGRPLLLACSKIADIENVCSITPFMPLRKPFWVLGLMTSLSMAYCSSWDARILRKIFFRTEVRAIGLKMAGSPDLLISERFAVHQV